MTKDSFKELNKFVLCHSDFNKVFKSKVHTLKSIYIYYRNDIKRFGINQQTFINLCSEYNSLVCESFIDNFTFKTCIGKFQLIKESTLMKGNVIRNKLRINYKQGTKENPMYYLNDDTDNYYFKRVWKKPIIKNIYLYFFKSSRYLRRTIYTNRQLIRCR